MVAVVTPLAPATDPMEIEVVSILTTPHAAAPAPAQDQEQPAATAQVTAEAPDPVAALQTPADTAVSPPALAMSRPTPAAPRAAAPATDTAASPPAQPPAISPPPAALHLATRAPMQRVRPARGPSPAAPGANHTASPSAVEPDGGASAEPPRQPPPPAQAVAGWDRIIATWLATHKIYPDAARERGEQGDVSIRFSIAPDGAVLSAAIVQGSGSGLLDAAALALLAGAHVPAPLAPQIRTVRLRYRLD